MIELRAANKSYRTGANALHVLRDIDLTIESGELVSMMGSSGSGKSTLLNILGILDDYDSGDYRLNGELIRGLPARRAAMFRNRHLGLSSSRST